MTKKAVLIPVSGATVRFTPLAQATMCTDGALAVGTVVICGPTTQGTSVSNVLHFLPLMLTYPYGIPTQTIAQH